MLKSNVTACGDRVFNETIKVKWGHECALIKNDGVLGRERGPDTFIEKIMWKYSSGRPPAASKEKELGRNCPMVIFISDF